MVTLDCSHVIDTLIHKVGFKLESRTFIFPYFFRDCTVIKMPIMSHKSYDSFWLKARDKWNKMLYVLTYALKYNQNDEQNIPLKYLNSHQLTSLTKPRKMSTTQPKVLFFAPFCMAQSSSHVIVGQDMPTKNVEVQKSTLYFAFKVLNEHIINWIKILRLLVSWFQVCFFMCTLNCMLLSTK